MERKKKLSDAELEIMLAIWEAGEPVTSSYILQQLKGRRWALSTLMTVLARLVEKGYIQCDRSTRTNFYTALVEEEDYKARESRSFLEKTYGSSLAGLVANLYNSRSLSEEDIASLRRFLDEAAGGKPSKK